MSVSASSAIAPPSEVTVLLAMSMLPLLLLRLISPRLVVMLPLAVKLPVAFKSIGPLLADATVVRLPLMVMLPAA